MMHGQKNIKKMSSLDIPGINKNSYKMIQYAHKHWMTLHINPTPFHSLQFSQNCLYRICLTLCMTIWQNNTFQIMNVEKLFALCADKYCIWQILKRIYTVTFIIIQSLSWNIYKSIFTTKQNKYRIPGLLSHFNRPHTLDTPLHTLQTDSNTYFQP